MNFLLLSASTGEGHNSAAHAIGEVLEKNGCEVFYRYHTNIQNKQLKDKKVSFFNRFVDEYFLKNKFIFGLFYAMALSIDAIHFSPIYLSNKKYAKDINKFIDDNHIDGVICTHMYPLNTMYYIRKKYNPNLPVYAVLTDYRPHPFFTEKIYGKGKFNFFIAGSQKNIDFFKKRGYQDSIVLKTGIPVHTIFSDPLSKDEARKQLGLPQDKKIMLIINDRSGAIISLTKKLNNLLNEDEMIIFDSIKDYKVEKQLKDIVQETKFQMFSYTDHLYLYLKACDVVLTKAGGSTTTEAAVSNIPIIHTSCMPWLESQNAQYFSQNGMSVYSENTNQIIDKALDLFRDKKKQEIMISKQKELINKKANEDIAKEILKQ